VVEARAQRCCGGGARNLTDCKEARSQSIGTSRAAGHSSRIAAAAASTRSDCRFSITTLRAAPPSLVSGH